MNKTYMTHEEVNKILRNGWDMPGFNGKEQPLWCSKVASMWRHMWIRCYDPTDKNYNKYYKDVIIADEFKLFSNYVKWIESQPNFKEFCTTCHEITWSVDKDKNGGHYFPTMMTLCTINENIKERNLRRGKMNPPKPVIGISKNRIFLFKKASDATKYGFVRRSICSVCNGNKKTHHGYQWKYINYKHNKTFRKKV